MANGFTTPYEPIDEFPDFTGASGGGPMRLTDRNMPVVWDDLERHDFSIVSVSNTTPIVITTSEPNYFQTGDKAVLSDSAVTAINGIVYDVTRLTSTTLSLTGTTASGAGGTQGRIFSPDRGVISRLIDAAQWLYNRHLRNNSTCARSQWPVDVADWNITDTGDDEDKTGGWSTSTSSITSFFSEYDDIPDGASLTSSSVYVHPAGGHGGLPGNMPLIETSALNVLTGAVTSLGTATDSSGNVSAYQARHAISSTFGSPFTYDRSKHRIITVAVSESGANALSGFRIGGATITWTGP